jgi:hypothetical protein
VSARLSPDGMYYWNGQEWRPVVSSGRIATAWTRPIQYAVAAWYGVQALGLASLPFWYINVMTQYADAMNRQNQELNPGAPTPPPELMSNIDTMMRVSFYVGVIAGLAIAAVLIIAAMKRWTWAYYAILVLLALEVISLALGALNWFAISALAGQYVGPPAWMVWAQLAAAFLSAGVFVWMLVALIKRGPWAMSRALPQVS